MSFDFRQFQKAPPRQKQPKPTPVTDAEKVERLFRLGQRCGIQPGSRLSGSAKPMVQPLQDFFQAILNDLCDGNNKNKFYSQKNVADALDRLGVASSTGKELQISHISNAVRKSIKKIGPAYSKPGYSGRNHHSFGSGEAPTKENFASLNRHES